MMKVGGTTEARVPDETVLNIVKELELELKTQISGKRGVEVETLFPGGSGATGILEPHSYKTQLVAGTNFFIKIKLPAGDFVHARIYKNLQGELSLHSVTEAKSQGDEIEYF